MQGPDHLYFLLDDQNRSLYVENGIVKRSSVPRPLEFTPDGWRKIKVDNARNQKYFALDRMYTVPLEFVEDGATILKDAYHKQGPEAKVYLGILKQKLFYDGTEYGWYHDKFVKGAIDFYQYNHVGAKVTVNVMESGLSKLIKARESVQYELDIDGIYERKVKMDGVRLKQKASFLILNGTGADNDAHIVQTQVLGTEQIQSIGAKSTFRTIINSIPDIYNSGENFLTTGNSATDVTIDYDFGINLSLSGVGSIFGTHYFFQLRGFDETGTQTVFQNIVDYNPGDPLLLYRDHRYSGSVTYNIPANTQLFLTSRTSQNEDFTTFVYDSANSNLDATYTYTHRTTFIKALNPEVVYKILIEKITDGAYQGESALLAANYDFMLTSGDALRGIPGAKLKISLSDFFQSFNTQFDIGLGEIGGKALLAYKSDFIDYSNPIDLGEVSKFKHKPATDYYFSAVKIGYPEQKYDDVNGKQEFNNTHTYTSAVTGLTKELNLVSVIRADCYGAEFTRINLEGKTTTDSESDDDVWFIHTKKTPITDPVEGTVYELNRDLNPFITGLLEPATVFNVFLSPKRCLERNGRYIHSCFYKMDTTKLAFQTTQKNANMATTNPVVVEKSDTSVGGLLRQLFSPNLLEFETPAPVDLVELLEASPIRAFKGTYLGFPFAGIPIKVGIAAGDFEAQTYQLLASPATDLTPLIEISE